MNDFLTELKLATRPMHEALERTGISHAIMSPDLNNKTYGEYLQRVLILHKDVEAVVFPALSSIIQDTGLRKKAGAITDDLVALGFKPSVKDIHFLDKTAESLHFNLGIMYVSEGSVLGGQYILKNIRQSLGTEAPGRFLNVYAEKTGTLWKSFLSQLESYQALLQSHEKAEIISGAVYGFERAYYIFNLDAAQFHEN